MKIRLLSDLHREFGNPLHLAPQENDGETVLILAGDIGLGLSGARWASQFSKRFLRVLYVLGNHEYYDQDFDALPAALREEVPPNLQLLDPGVAKIGGIRFIGATLWTDFNRENVAMLRRASKTMNDYSMIDRDGAPLTPRHILERHKAERGYIHAALQDDLQTPTVVITHTLPSYACIHPDYKGEESNAFYASELSHLMLDRPNLKAWVFGHSHRSCRFEIGTCRLYSNPFGYYPKEVNSDFDPNFYFEVSENGIQKDEP